jgi:hypothetical protein
MHAARATAPSERAGSPAACSAAVNAPLSPLMGPVVV